jgi:hypothetical protein
MLCSLFGLCPGLSPSFVHSFLYILSLLIKFTVGASHTVFSLKKRKPVPGFLAGNIRIYCVAWQKTNHFLQGHSSWYCKGGYYCLWCCGATYSWSCCRQCQWLLQGIYTQWTVSRLSWYILSVICEIFSPFCSYTPWPHTQTGTYSWNWHARGLHIRNSLSPVHLWIVVWFIHCSFFFSLGII